MAHGGRSHGQELDDAKCPLVNTGDAVQERRQQDNQFAMHVFKVIAILCPKRFKVWAEEAELLPNYQWGFRRIRPARNCRSFSDAWALICGSSPSSRRLTRTRPRGSDLLFFFHGRQGKGQNPFFCAKKESIRRVLFQRVKPSTWGRHRCQQPRLVRAGEATRTASAKPPSRADAVLEKSQIQLLSTWPKSHI